MPFVSLPDGTQLFYETMGVGEPLLLIAGQSSDHHLWDRLRDTYATQYQVTVFDWRGTGQSDKPEQPPYSTRGFARDVIALLDAIGVERSHVFGISMGGRVAQWLGIDYPDRIGGLVLGCTTPGNAHGVARTAEVTALFQNNMDPAAQQAMLELQYAPEWISAHSDLLAERARMQIEEPIPDYTRALHYQASEGHDSWDLLPTIKAATLVIHGSDDKINPTANAPLLAERIPNAALYIVQGGRHGFFDEYHEEVSATILDFLARHPLTG